MHVGGFPDASRPLQGLQGPQETPGPPAALRHTFFERPLPARLKFHAGWSGWTRPPTMAGGAGGNRGVARLRRVCKRE